MEKFKIYYFVLGGIFLGVSLYGIYISKVYSYLSDEPTACVNCHIMTPHFATWFHSSHRNRATCNDCHIPQDNSLRALWFKMNDGLRHSFIFTFGNYPQVIRIRPAGARVVQDNCLRCHSNQLSFVTLIKGKEFSNEHIFTRQCWDCHREVPHGRLASQASTPFARIPNENSVVPNWLKKEIKLLNK
ncbi:MAG: cytochrome c nitrite reductase small subunit [Ignavibacteria bacterium]|nr:cytochrome c nitrite reductase small subunit [Ignavibacteria bacterium]